METRLSIGPLPPVGKYSADECRMANEGLSVELTGYQSGADPACCYSCSQTVAIPKELSQPVYFADGVLRRKCSACGVPFAGMTGLEHLRRNKPAAWLAPLPVPVVPHP